VSYTFIFRKQFYFVISGLKIIGHGNPDSNLESPCISEPRFLCVHLRSVLFITDALKPAVFQIMHVKVMKLTVETSRRGGGGAKHTWER
jgi:hypothetical protein